MAIEQARFGERLYVEYEIDPSVQCSIPPLSVQPLVDNAVRHGILKRMEGGVVRLSVQSCQGAVKIVVEDNGVGMPKERLERLFEENSSGVGLRNIEFRMRRHYGYGLNIESEVDLGTRVTITVPAAEP